MKTSLRHLGRRKIVTIKTCWGCLQEMSWRRLEEVLKTFNSTGCKMVIEWKFSGFPTSPVSYANTMTQDFHTSENVFAVQTFWRIFVRHECRTGHFLTVITLIWSRRQCDADNFIFMMTFVTYAKVGSSILKSVVGFSNSLIHKEGINHLCLFFNFKVFLM